jgi:hypothetical protein
MGIIVESSTSTDFSGGILMKKIIVTTAIVASVAIELLLTPAQAEAQKAKKGQSASVQHGIVVKS